MMWQCIEPNNRLGDCCESSHDIKVNQSHQCSHHKKRGSFYAISVVLDSQPIPCGTKEFEIDVMVVLSVDGCATKFKDQYMVASKNILIKKYAPFQALHHHLRALYIVWYPIFEVAIIQLRIGSNG
jgi:hypothetical protein